MLFFHIRIYMYILGRRERNTSKLLQEQQPVQKVGSFNKNSCNSGCCTSPVSTGLTCIEEVLTYALKLQQEEFDLENPVCFTTLYAYCHYNSIFK